MLLQALEDQVAPSFDALADATSKLGYPVVTGLVLILLLWYVLHNVMSSLAKSLIAVAGKVDVASAHFDDKLDDMIREQGQQFRQVSEQQMIVMREVSREQTRALGDLTTVLRHQTEQLSANGEVLRMLVMLLTHTQAEVNVAKREVQQHRDTVEPILKENGGYAG
jgi:hypothetical protein